MIKIIFTELDGSTILQQQDFSGYLVKAPSFSKSVESDLKGEAGAIVFDKANVSLYYMPGGIVDQCFNTNIIEAKRYFFEISIKDELGLYDQEFAGICDFTSIEWTASGKEISFDIVDKISALGILSNLPIRGGYMPDTNLLVQHFEWDVLTPYSADIYSSPIDTLNSRMDNTNRFLLPGEIIVDPKDLWNNVALADRRFMLITKSEVRTYDYNGSTFHKLYIEWLPATTFPDSQKIGNDYITSPWYYSVSIPKMAKTFYEVDAGIYENGVLASYDAVKILHALLLQQWPDANLITYGYTSFQIPLEFYSQLVDENPFDMEPLEAVKMLVNSMQSYLYTDSAGNFILKSKDYIKTNPVNRTLGATKIVDGDDRKKLFWDKLIDAVEVKVKSWVLDSKKTPLEGYACLAVSDKIKPKNKKTVEIFAPAGCNTQALLDQYAHEMALSFLQFYGQRHFSYNLILDFDSNVRTWELTDTVTIDGDQYFICSMDIDIEALTADILLVSTQSFLYDVDQIIISLDENSSNSVGGYVSSSSSGSVTYSSGTSTNGYLWDGSNTGLNAALGRQSLGLDNIANIGNGSISNDEFNALNNISGNIQAQLNNKEPLISTSNNNMYFRGGKNWANFNDAVYASLNPLTPLSLDSLTGDLAIDQGALMFGDNTNGFSFTGVSDTRLVGAGDLKINIPQRIDSGASPKFAGLNIGNANKIEDLTLNGNAWQGKGKRTYSDGYSPGWGNFGYEIKTDANGVSSLVIDNLDVRRAMHVYELIIRQLQVVNGNFLFSDGAKILSADTDIIELEDVTGHGVTPFVAEDILLVQRSDLTNGKVIFAQCQVISTLPNMALEISWIVPPDHFTDLVGCPLCRIGNYSDRLRQASIYIATNDDGSPFIDIRDGVDSPAAWGSIATKLRIGLLNSLTSTQFGALSGYGLYADGNVYLGGMINVKEGSKVSAWDINQYGLLNSAANVRLMTSDDFTGLNIQDKIKIGKYAASAPIASMTDSTERLIQAPNISNAINATHWNISGKAYMDDNSEIAIGLAYIGGQTPFLQSELGMGVSSWDFNIRHQSYYNSLLMGKQNQLKFRVLFEEWEYNTDGGTFEIFVNFEDVSGQVIYQQKLFTQVISAAIDIDYRNTGVTFNLPVMDNCTKIYFMFNYSGGAQGQSLYPLRMNLFSFKMDSYQGYTADLNQDGLLLYNSPQDYIDFTNGKADIEVANFKVAGKRVPRFHGKLSAEPAGDVQIGDMYITSANIVKICVAVKVTSTGSNTWVALN